LYYTYIPQSFIEVYVAQYTQCCMRKNFSASVIRETIILKKFLQRVQVDLVSFEKYLDKKYQYIVHLHDHFTRFSWTCSLYTKKAAEVAAFLLSFIKRNPYNKWASSPSSIARWKTIIEEIGVWPSNSY
ncbi:17233_t:CDS:2, partial [Dentiscutata heterogama]